MSSYNGTSSSSQYGIPPSCKYPGCDEDRVFKITGELHNFCKYHRQKASENQRRYAQNKRERKRQKQMAQSPTMKNTYNDKYEYVNPMAHYPAYSMVYNYQLTDPTSVDFSEGSYVPQFYQHPKPVDEIIWLAEYLVHNQCY